MLVCYKNIQSNWKNRSLKSKISKQKQMNKTRYFKNLASLHLNIKMLADWKKRLALNIIIDWFYLYNVDQRRAIEMTRRTATNSMDGKNILGNCIIPHPVSIKPLIKTIVVMQFVYCLFFFSFSFFFIWTLKEWGLSRLLLYLIFSFFTNNFFASMFSTLWFDLS